MGSPDARAYSRNKRGIAGSLIWINFDRHALLNLVQQCAGTFVADIDEIRPQYTSTTNGGAVFQSSVVRSAGIPASATIDALDTTLTSAGQNAQLATPWYSDQILPFDVTLADMLDAWADDPQEQSERGADQYACHFPPKIPAWKKLAPVINEKSPAQGDAHISTAQQTKKVTLPISIRAKEPPVVKDATSGQEDKVGKGTPVSSNVDAYIRRQQILDEKAQRLTAMIDEIPPRPIYSAKSMKRQGKSEPS